MRRSLAVLLASAALSSAAQAQQVIGVGNSSCGAWTAARLEPLGPMATVMMSWVQGYLTALNLRAPTILNGQDNAALFAWVDNYCREKPLENIAFAATNLYAELSSRQRP